MTISDLRRRPDFLGTVADRIWRGFWSEHGHPLEQIAVLTRHSLGRDPLPFCLVAHEDGQFLGTVSVVLSEEAARPDYSPWVAALWVDPAARCRGIGGALVAEAVLRTAALGIPRLYLACRPDLRAFYEQRGWTVWEAEIDTEGPAILIREA
ncbi:GNAT family N-acetyltransferase [Labrys wisconsinensis]|uniref:GNAT superfamily N-acetyltransferase n=1 Tax=Labrys wisconsinensis TaxID=425677 RepID=A0ABU0J4S0_9HYPH|nr:GNAT family N-acetyltransferase [Labrys wisconsinensis]MDQ0468269.1 GNAT superfamily N-acetyltransferase [Labrys wisconsinensis]